MEAIKSTPIFHEEFSETCSGPSCSVDGDETHSGASCSIAGDDVFSKASSTVEGDDAISLCSWTTDQGDFDLTSELAAKTQWNDFENMQDHTTGGAPSQYWQGPQNCASMPMAPGIWHEPVMLPAYQFCYLVVPQNFYSDGTKKPQNSKKGRASARYAPQQQAALPSDATASNFNKATPSCQSDATSDTSQQTNVILRNFPNEYTREDLLRLLDDEGFSAAYDFVHLPIDFQKKFGLGYAVVNMVSHQMALSIWEHFAGFDRWDTPCDTVCEVSWNRPHQGLEAHIERYRNSPLMHDSVPDVYRPAVFDHGLRIEFAAPTTRIRAPRIRHQKGEGAPRS
jgi:hypothetical protein